MNFNLSKFRKDHNLTQQTVADWFELPQSSVSAMESGRQKVTQEHIATLREHIDFNPEEYMEDDTKVASVWGNKGRLIGNITGLSEDGLNKILALIDKTTSQEKDLINQLMSKVTKKDDALSKALEENSLLKDENYQLRIQFLEMQVALAKKGIEL